MEHIRGHLNGMLIRKCFVASFTDTHQVFLKEIIKSGNTEHWEFNDSQIVSVFFIEAYLTSPNNQVWVAQTLIKFKFQ